MNERRLLLPLAADFALLVFFGLLKQSPRIMDLSSLNGARLSGLTSISTQEVVAILAVGFLFFNEISDQRYGSTRKIFARLRESYLPVCVLLLMLLSITVCLKVLGFS